MENGIQFKGSLYLQSYQLTTGKPVAFFEDGKLAVVDNVFGKGKTRLVGSFPGYAYSKDPDEGTRQFFGGLVSWAGMKQHITTNDERIVARLQTDNQDIYLWVSNVAREAVNTELAISEAWGQFTSCEPIWGEKMQMLEGNKMMISIPERDMLIMKIE
jgi:beta-galactosidase